MMLNVAYCLFSSSTDACLFLRQQDFNHLAFQSTTSITTLQLNRSSDSLYSLLGLYVYRFHHKARGECQEADIGMLHVN